jgi:hypothetical protein
MCEYFSRQFFILFCYHLLKFSVLLVLSCCLGKRVEGEDKFKGLAIETFGMSMSAQSYTLREGSTYRQALLRMGDAHQNMGIAQTELVSFEHKEAYFSMNRFLLHRFFFLFFGEKNETFGELELGIQT